MKSTMLRGALAATLALAASLSMTGGANDSLADQFRNGDNKQYIAGDGTFT
jgi:uncharacterized membrane protein